MTKIVHESGSCTAADSSTKCTKMHQISKTIPAPTTGGSDLRSPGKGREGKGRDRKEGKRKEDKRKDRRDIGALDDIRDIRQ